MSVIARIVASIFRSIVRRRLIAERPFTEVRLPSQPGREIERLYTGTVRALEVAMPPPHCPRWSPSLPLEEDAGGRRRAG